MEADILGDVSVQPLWYFCLSPYVTLEVKVPEPWLVFLCSPEAVTNCRLSPALWPCVLPTHAPGPALALLGGTDSSTGEFLAPNYARAWPCTDAAASPALPVFLSSTAINCWVRSEVINIAAIYHLEISKKEQMSCFVR